MFKRSSKEVQKFKALNTEIYLTTYVPTEVWSADDAALWWIFSSYLLRQSKGIRDFSPKLIQTHRQNKVDLSIKHIKTLNSF
jgi:hypothetical protein